eukprot:gene28117-49920_t
MVLRHVLPNALLPAINVVALTVAWLLGGVVVIEMVFNYPGLGRLMIGAISDRDLALVQSIALIVATVYVLVNLSADLLTLVANPRLRTAVSKRAPHRPGALRRLAQVLKEMLARPSGAIGLLLVLLHLVVAVASPWLVPFDFKAISATLILSPPDATHWFGTDHLGRDVFTRTLLGGREAILVTVVATPLAVLWGGFAGVYLGLAGGRLDDVLMRVVDAFLALPWILKMLLLIATFGNGIEVLIPTLIVFYGIPVIRI